MSQKEKVVQGAICKCQFGTTPDKLVVLTHKKWYANDKDGREKLLATHKDIGVPFQNKTFGSCKKMNNNPCVPSITKWDGYYEKEKYDPPGGYVLTKDCKATCAVAGTACVEITMSGQTGQPMKKNIENADEELQAQVNPLVNMKKMNQKDPYEFLNIQ
ncbi:hypothetical protein A8C56_18415 [Niabella ginsenosidivorans]|uniref:DUF4280 domain-containing protein n=1 Tax=Niabella ginsenosidivorans TaxID=1176587 RepID=A0A1A9I4S8_9BACT|nr:DUF4280 domain-containing protein [Niabella ginsenosidivorans]ANH82687.1 hypothetical protein A8C56_18415 [Niabella ginsenosidivorans]